MVSTMHSTTDAKCTRQDREPRCRTRSGSNPRLLFDALAARLVSTLRTHTTISHTSATMTDIIPPKKKARVSQKKRLQLKNAAGKPKPVKRAEPRPEGQGQSRTAHRRRMKHAYKEVKEELEDADLRARLLRVVSAGQRVPPDATCWLTTRSGREYLRDCGANGDRHLHPDTDSAVRTATASGHPADLDACSLFASPLCADEHAHGHLIRAFTYGHPRRDEEEEAQVAPERQGKVRQIPTVSQHAEERG